MMVLNLPQELLEEILCRVPATSLKQLRLTCKEWNRLFNDRTFSRKHFDKAPKQFLITVLEERCRLSSLSINLHSGFPSEEFTGELSPIDYHSNSSQVIIMKIFHCDGLFLCTILKDTRIVVWNPCTGQKKWIQTGENLDENGQDFVLGYHQDNKSCDKSYKILSYKGYNYGDQEFKIYDIKSNSWRNLDVTPIPSNYFTCSDYRVSLKGNTYWFAYDLKDEQLGLISFDYTTERFERLWLPFQCDISDHDYSLSVVGEEKLSVLLQLKDAPRREIWITNKMDDETKEMSWRKLFEVEVGTRYYMWSGRPFLVDEEKKIVVCCEKCQKKSQPVITVSMVEADSNATRVYFPVVTMTSYWPHFVDYVPSLIQIQQSEANEKELNS